MPEYLTPGIYIEEIDKGPRPITGVPTSTAAFIGETERGLTKPRAVTSYKDFVHRFGGAFADAKFMPYAVAGFFDNGGQDLYVCRVVGAAATTAEVVFGDFVIKAVGPGLWGNRVYVKVDDGSTRKPGPDDTMVPVGVRLRAAYYDRQPNGNPADWFNDPNQPPFPSVSETFDDLDADEQSPNYWYTRLYDNSALIELARISGPADALPTKQFAQLATNGGDGTPPDANDFEGEVQLPQRSAPQGLAALKLDSYDDVALVYAPGASVAVAQKVISHCETLKYRFAVIDLDKGVNASDFEPRSVIKDTKYAAAYYPWLIISGADGRARKEVPPGGHVLGIFARTDSQRGVSKAPAGVDAVLHGVLGVTAEVDEKRQAVLSPRGVNVIRKFPQGILVWGARTISSDLEGKYLNVRRLLIYIERSIDKATQWTVFEPNGEQLWGIVRRTIGEFLHNEWRNGTLLGGKPEDAYFVKCGRDTMSQNDLDNGRLLCLVGIAPARPAEFVIIRICLKACEAKN